MRGYAEEEVFSLRELTLLRRAIVLVEAMPEELDGEPLRCHEVARVVGKVLGLEVCDGFYGFVDHSWCWTEPLDLSRMVGRTGMSNVLDPYVPGSLPLVQLRVSNASTAFPYRRDAARTDIRQGVIDRLLALHREML